MRYRINLYKYIIITKIDLPDRLILFQYDSKIKSTDEIPRFKYVHNKLVGIDNNNNNNISSTFKYFNSISGRMKIFS